MRLRGRLKGKDPLIFVPFLAAVLVFVFYLMLFLPFNGTESMPIGFYIRLPIFGEVKVGDIVQVRNPMAPGFMGVYDDATLMKRVVRITDDGFYEVRGESKYSYDSRYFGLVSRDFLIARFYPALIFNLN